MPHGLGCLQQFPACWIRAGCYFIYIIRRGGFEHITPVWVFTIPAVHHRGSDVATASPPIFRQGRGSMAAMCWLLVPSKAYPTNRPPTWLTRYTSRWGGAQETEYRILNHGTTNLRGWRKRTFSFLHGSCSSHSLLTKPRCKRNSSPADTGLTLEAKELWYNWSKFWSSSKRFKKNKNMEILHTVTFENDQFHITWG